MLLSALGSCGYPMKRYGGARRDRTDDLLNANQALSQLSYGPRNLISELSADAALRALHHRVAGGSGRT